MNKSFAASNPVFWGVLLFCSAAKALEEPDDQDEDFSKYYERDLETYRVSIRIPGPLAIVFVILIVCCCFQCCIRCINKQKEAAAAQQPPIVAQAVVVAEAEPTKAPAADDEGTSTVTTVVPDIEAGNTAKQSVTPPTKKTNTPFKPLSLF